LLEFEPKNSLLPKNFDIYNNISKTNSVCVTIRSFKEIKSSKTVYNLYDVCSPQYFYDALNLMSQKIENPHFFIFSDDITWVKNKMNLDKFNVVYENEGSPVWEKLRLMYSCKHFIISNSTFSWWAQYLSRNDDKIVISPKSWFNDEYESKLIDDNWIKI